MTHKVRGFKVVGDYLYAVIDQYLIQFEADLASTTVGTLELNAPYTHHEFVTLEWNGFRLAIADGVNGYTYDPNTQTLTVIPDWPGGYSMAYCGGFLLSEGREPQGFFLYQSDVYEAGLWDPLNYGSSDFRPDRILRIYAQGDTVLVFGEASIEMWQKSGAEGFAFVQLPGAVSNYGLAAVNSVASAKGGLTALLRSADGSLMVARIDGYQPAPISRTAGKTSFIEQEWMGYPTVADAVATAYTIAGHTLYQITFPSANGGLGYTWICDQTLGVWTRFSTGDEHGKFKGELAVEFNGNVYMSDSDTGNLLKIDNSAYTDLGAEVYYELTSNPLKDEGKCHSLDKLWLDFEVGKTLDLPLGTAYDPYVIVQLSKDGGNTWKPEQRAYLGRQGEGVERVIVRRLGQYHDGVVRIKGSYPVRFVLAATGVEIS